MERKVLWIASTKRDLVAFPPAIRTEMGFAIYLAQVGLKHRHTKPLKGFGGTGVLEIVEDHDGDTYRCVYTIRFAEHVYVLHAFQKKSKHGIATPQADLDLIRHRLRLAEEDHRRREGGP